MEIRIDPKAKAYVIRFIQNHMADAKVGHKTVEADEFMHVVGSKPAVMRVQAYEQGFLDALDAVKASESKARASHGSPPEATKRGSSVRKAFGCLLLVLPLLAVEAMARLSCRFNPQSVGS